jgi:hypothetical protein
MSRFLFFWLGCMQTFFILKNSLFFCSIVVRSRRAGTRENRLRHSQSHRQRHSSAGSHLYFQRDYRRYQRQCAHGELFETGVLVLVFILKCVG